MLRNAKRGTAAAGGPGTGRHAGRRWIDHWNPEDPDFWRSRGQRVARRNLGVSILTDHLGFCLFVVWTIVVINLGNIGISLTLSQQFVLTLIPNLVGSTLRIPYTFALPRFGGRLWTTISAGLLLIPAGLLAIVVPSHWLAQQPAGPQFWILFACAATAGLGGGIFASSMANISFFYPEARKGFALGLNAAGGNLGVASSQLLVPLVLIAGVAGSALKKPVHPVHIAYAGWVFIPLIVIAAVAAWLFMDSLSEAKSDHRSFAEAMRAKETWILSLLYIGTFGSFIGFSFALPLVIKNTFPEFLAAHPFIATYLAGLSFLGALVGSLARPVGGWMSDRMGGAKVTVAVFGAMAACTGAAAYGVEQRSFAGFLVAYLGIFLLSGVGNGSIYKMIPSVFAALGARQAAARGLARSATTVEFKRRAAAVIGIAGAIGAFGGVLVQVVFRQASLGVSALQKLAKAPAEKLAIAAAHANWSVPALWVFLGAYLVLGAVTWACFLRQTESHLAEPAAEAAEAGMAG
ncbi:MAG TPA: MFS transporter [Actinomycetota bacterium]|nr:MFS transporter [Actinomycetota bacterium]